MKDYKTILAEIKSICDENNRIDACLWEIHETRRAITNKTERIAAIKRTAEEENRLCTQKTDNSAVIGILANNAKKAMFAEVAPVVTEVLNKYAGKSHGPKTAEKIQNEIEGKAGVYFYIGSSSQKIYVKDRENCFGVDIYPTNGFKILTDDNKICRLTLDSLKVYDADEDFVEDPRQQLEEIKAAKKAVLDKQIELDAAINAYNAVAVGLNKIHDANYFRF